MIKIGHINYERIIKRFQTSEVDIISILCEDDSKAEKYADNLMPCIKGEESVDRDQERLLEEIYKEMYATLLCYASAALKDHRFNLFMSCEK